VNIIDVVLHDVAICGMWKNTHIAVLAVLFLSTWFLTWSPWVLWCWWIDIWPMKMLLGLC